ncbi:Phosphatidylinositol-binding clathrin assembly protein LAP [Paragonimus heterotremus]|uniref:Phosphatidylinositol-binding clathrin assembly protein LAP n=1 Tax=Paragonimus heterotremus TaxID=100268 RepID=A0A8J4WTE4_9TREM|nr:Phosphatidylinositol-binding clathrin assembly protein LAP [Paragonimus heterotremus]
MAGKVVKQLAGSGTGQSLSDMMTAVKHTLSGSLVAKVICKATTEEMISPKRKHLACEFSVFQAVTFLDLVQCTFEPRLSVPDFANYLVSRTQHSNLVVVFKAFITIHHLMQYGHEVSLA